MVKLLRNSITLTDYLLLIYLLAHYCTLPAEGHNINLHESLLELVN